MVQIPALILSFSKSILILSNNFTHWNKIENASDGIRKKYEPFSYNFHDKGLNH